MLEEREEVDDPAHAHRAREHVRELGDPGHRHVSAVGAAGDADALAIGDTGAHHMVDARLDVAHALEALVLVVQMHEGLAEACRSAHIGREDRDAVREQRLISAVEERPFLALRAAVEREHAWTGGAEVRR